MTISFGNTEGLIVGEPRQRLTHYDRFVWFFLYPFLIMSELDPIIPTYGKVISAFQTGEDKVKQAVFYDRVQVISFD